MIKHWGERCPDYEEGCAICQAWDNFDTMIAKLESGDVIYEHKIKALNFFNKRKLDELSAKGWNVCAATFVPNLSDMIAIPRAANTLFYFRKKL